MSAAPIPSRGSFETPTTPDDTLQTVRELVAKLLAPKVLDVDIKAEYPEEFLRALGQAGGFKGQGRRRLNQGFDLGQSVGPGWVVDLDLDHESSRSGLGRRASASAS